MLLADRAVKDGYRVVGRAGGWLYLPANDAGKPGPPEIDAQLAVVVVTHQLGEHLGDAIKGIGPQGGFVGRIDARGVGPECGD